MQSFLPGKYPSLLNKILLRFLFVFVLMFILMVPFPHSYLPDVGKYTSPFFEKIAGWLAVNVFNIHHKFSPKLISDSTGLYIHTFFLLIVSVVAAFIWNALDKRFQFYERISYWLVTVASYYLAMQLFMYGFSKIFKVQFYLPEPNTLYTTFGNLPRDLAYWSVMGTSRMYSIFLGCTEVIAALLLLFKRTRVIGSFIAMGVLLNIVLINFSFDISVKLYSMLLLLLSIIISAPGIKMLYHFLVFKRIQIHTTWRPVYRSKQRLWLYRIGKAGIVVLIVSDALAPYVRANNFDDDAIARPLLHGAYEVKYFVKNSDTILPLITDTVRWKRVFIHRAGYLIVEAMNDEMQDYLLEYDTSNYKLLLKNYADDTVAQFHYSIPVDSVLLLNGLFKKDTLQLRLNKKDLQKLPLLQNESHWTMDE